MQDRHFPHHATVSAPDAVFPQPTVRPPRHRSAGNAPRHRRAIAAFWLLGASALLTAASAHAQQTPPAQLLPPPIPAPPALPLLVPPMPAPAAKPPTEKASFAPCDGYLTPDKATDNYIHGSVLLGVGTGTYDFHPNEKLPLGAAGVVACDVALASPLLRPEFTLRRHHLLVAKAMHLVAAGRPGDALPVLDSARNLSLDVPALLRARSFAIEEKSIRAYALIKLGNVDAAEPLIADVAAARPYAPSVQRLADMLRTMSAEASGKMTVTDVRISNALRGGGLDPSRLAPAMMAALGQGRMSDVVKLGSGLTMTTPSAQGSWQEVGSLDKNQTIGIRQLIAGITAYAEAAIGKASEAEARLAQLESEIAREAALPPPAEWSPSFLGMGKSKQQVASEVAAYQRYATSLAEARNGLQNWRKLIALRGNARTLSKEEVINQLVKAVPQASLTIADVLSQSPALDNDAGRAEIASMRAISARALPDRTSPSALLQLMPRPETPETQPKSSGPRTGFFQFGPTAGATRVELPGGQRWDIHFSHKLASAATVEEIALMNAALLAKEKGCGRFLLETRRTYERELRTQYDASYAGRDGALRVWLVCDDKPLPPELAGAEWREMAVDPIYDRLSVQYADILPQEQAAATAVAKP